MNFASGTVWTGDNLPVMRGMNSASVDLIYLDPPFNSGKDYEAPIGSEAAGAHFKDTWTLDDVDVHEHGELADRNPAAYLIVSGAGAAHGKSMRSYLIYMATRLLEMRRILKPTGSIYLHCDPTASHYLKLLMDSIFGAAKFQNEIVWKRTSSHNRAKRWGPIHDCLFFYGGATWNRVLQPLDSAYVEKHYRRRDEFGKYRTDNLTGPGPRDGDTGQPWRGINPSEKNRHWELPPDRALPDWFNFPSGYAELTARQRLDVLDAQGLIYWPTKGGGMPAFKRYLTERSGQPVTDMVLDIPPLSGAAKERLGYPTQKPLAFLERIIAASSNPGDMVFDPFCGCATTLVAAEKLDRQWAGCDLSPLAVSLVSDRIREFQGKLWSNVTPLDQPPKRTDLGVLPNYRTNAHRLYGEQEGVCAGCETHFPFRVMEVDHKLPRSRGGQDNPENLQLLCSHCNRSKGNKTMAEWRAAQ
ncbi:MAG: DNA methyltransferase [Gemmatimonadota bacterium]|nr:DNA methyltransferase [Gemmatimonadota bacterium]